MFFKSGIRYVDIAITLVCLLSLVYYRWCRWCTIVGVLVYCLLLLFYRMDRNPTDLVSIVNSSNFSTFSFDDIKKCQQEINHIFEKKMVQNAVKMIKTLTDAPLDFLNTTQRVMIFNSMSHANIKYFNFFEVKHFESSETETYFIFKLEYHTHQDFRLIDVEYTTNRYYRYVYSINGDDNYGDFQGKSLRKLKYPIEEQSRIMNDIDNIKKCIKMLKP